MLWEISIEMSRMNEPKSLCKNEYSCLASYFETTSWEELSSMDLDDIARIVDKPHRILMLNFIDKVLQPQLEQHESKLSSSSSTTTTTTTQQSSHIVTIKYIRDINTVDCSGRIVSNKFSKLRPDLLHINLLEDELTKAQINNNNNNNQRLFTRINLSGNNLFDEDMKHVCSIVKIWFYSG